MRPSATVLHPTCRRDFSFPVFFPNLCPSALSGLFFSFLSPWPQILHTPLFSGFFALYRAFSAFLISLVPLRAQAVLEDGQREGLPEPARDAQREHRRPVRGRGVRRVGCHCQRDGLVARLGA